MARREQARRMSAADRRQQIVAVARRLFAQRGYDATTLEDVASECGVTKPVVYRHFAGKHDLYIAVLEDHLQHLISRLWVALSSAPQPRARLRHGLEEYFAFVEERPEGFRMLLDAAARMDPEIHRRLGAGWDALAEGIARTVGDLLRAAGLDPAGAPIYSRSLVGMTQLVAEWWLRTQRMPREDVIDYLLALAWRGFDGLPRDPTKYHAEQQALEEQPPSPRGIPSDLKAGQRGRRRPA